MADKPPELRPRPRTRCDDDPKNCALVTALSAVATTAAYVLSAFIVRHFAAKETVFTVAITGVTGLLDPAAAAAAAPSPVAFNLTLQIDNTRSSAHDACVPELSSADVSYGGASLAGGAVPPLCAAAGQRASGPVAAAAAAATSGRAPGEGAAAAAVMTQALRDRLAAELAAGNASVHVTVTMPEYCQADWCSDVVLSCEAKIGGGTSPACQLDLLQIEFKATVEY